MAAPAKFLLDLDFSSPERRSERTPNAAEMARVADAEARGYRAGFEAAAREAEGANDRRLTMALEDIQRGMAAIAGGFAGIEARMETEAVEVALAVARKVCAELIAAEPLAEMMALVSDCFRHLTSTPHIVVRVADALYDRAKEQIERAAKHSGFAGRLVILADPDIPAGDCRIEWADGGVVRERAAAEAKIEELVGRYLSVRTRAGAR